MAGWKPKALWFSPRASKGPTPRVEEIQTGPNSYRYGVVKKEPDRLETKMLDQGPSYEDYRKGFSKKAKKSKQPKVGFGRRNHNQWAEDAYGDDVMTHYNEPKYHAPVYTFSSERWVNWSYNGYSTINSDDNTDMFVKEPISYVTPSREQITAKSGFFAHDRIKLVKELARVCYFKMIDDKEYISDAYEDENNSPISTEEWRKKKAIFDNVYETYVPGSTPLEQALAISHKLQDMESRKKRRGASNYHDGNSSFVFKRDDYRDATLNSQLDMNDMSKKFKMEILNKISLLGDFGSQFKVEKATGEKEVANSDIRRTKLMRSYEQFHMVEKYQMLFPNFDIKFLTKDLLVSVPVSTSEKKQKIIILCDFSGSMNRDDKQTWVNGILIDRFRYVIKGEAEVFFSFFVSSNSTLHFTHVKNEQDVIEFWKNFSNYPGSNATDIGKIVTYVSEEIKKKRLHNLRVDLSEELPEILIINDGEDYVGYTEFPYKVNAISLVSFSEELKDLCIASGGKQIQIRQDNSIIAHSDQGTETIAD
jgi:hypothetical protein